jgi:predicted PolB exonuclease-like 3'-5' exonuclease
MPTTLVLDIETVPDGDLYKPTEPAPGTEKPFPPLYACKVITLGVMWLDDALACKKIGTIGQDTDEPGILSNFSKFVDKYSPTLVTWNGRSFDLPVVALRSLHHGLSIPWYYRNRDLRYRYSAVGHLDLCDFLSDHGATRMMSLNAAARLIGLPGKEGLDGSQVEGLYRAGQIEQLQRYCLSDVAQTAFLLLRQRLLLGQLDSAGYHQAASALLATLETDGRFEPLLAHIDRPRLLGPAVSKGKDSG